MKEPAPQEDIGGTTVHVGDCYVWVEIHSLDSATDYCEYLPNHDLQISPLGSELVMLDVTSAPGSAKSGWSGWIYSPVVEPPLASRLLTYRFPSRTASTPANKSASASSLLIYPSAPAPNASRTIWG